MRQEFMQPAQTINPKIKNYFFITIIFILIILRFILFHSNEIPPGYDPGMYRNLFLENSESLQIGKLEQTYWAEQKHYIGISYISHISLISGINIDFIIKYQLIFFEILLLISIYYFFTTFYNKKVGLTGILLYTLTTNSIYLIIYSHYKTIIAIPILLFALYFLKNKKLIPSILFGIFLSLLHKPTFFLFAIIIFLYWIINNRNLKTFSYGLTILIIFLLFNINSLIETFNLLFNILSKDSIASSATGNYISIHLFLKSIITLIPFFLLGLYNSYYKKKQYLTIPSYILIILTLFITIKFFFYLRWLAYLNIIFLFFTSIGIIKLLELTKNKKQIIQITTKIFIGAILLYNSCLLYETIDEIYVKIDKSGLEGITWLNENTNQNSQIFINDKYYLPWVLGWSNRTLISNGDFSKGYEKISITEWENFYKGNFDTLNKYFKNNSYIYIGELGKINKYNYKPNKCFQKLFENDKSIVLKTLC